MTSRLKYNKISHTPIGRIVVFIIWVFLCITSGWVTDCADLDNYRNGYENTSLTELYITSFNNPGFNYLISVFQRMGVSFDIFHILFFICIITYLVWFVWKYSERPAIVLLLYIAVAFIGDIIQMKNTLALVFLYIALTGIIDRNNEYNKLVTAIIILISATIHIGFLVYLVILLYDKKINNTFYIIFMMTISIAGHSILQIFTHYAVLLDADRMVGRAEGYLANGSVFSVFACSFVYFLNLFTCNHFFRYLKGSNIRVDRLTNINVLISVIIIFSSVNMTFFRLFRNIILFNSVFIINGYSQSKKNAIDLLIVVFYFFVMSYFFLLTGDIWDNVAIIFQNNSLF